MRQVRSLVASGDATVRRDLQARTGLQDVEGELGQLGEKIDELAAALQQRARERDAAEKRKLRDHAHQQTIVAALGQCALVINDLEASARKAPSWPAQMLADGISAVFERLPDGRMIMLAGTGWRPGPCARPIAFHERNPKPGFSAATGEVTVVDESGVQTRFKLPPVLAEHGIVGGITSAIPDPQLGPSASGRVFHPPASFTPTRCNSSFPPPIPLAWHRTGGAPNRPCKNWLPS